MDKVGITILSGRQQISESVEPKLSLQPRRDADELGGSSSALQLFPQHKEKFRKTEHPRLEVSEKSTTTCFRLAKASRKHAIALGTWLAVA